MFRVAEPSNAFKKSSCCGKALFLCVPETRMHQLLDLFMSFEGKESRRNVNTDFLVLFSPKSYHAINGIIAEFTASTYFIDRLLKYGKRFAYIRDLLASLSLKKQCI